MRKRQEHYARWFGDVHGVDALAAVVEEGLEGDRVFEQANDQRRQEIVLRWWEIDREIATIHEGKVTVGTDPATREGELLEEQDELEFELGQDYFNNAG